MKYSKIFIKRYIVRTIKRIIAVCLYTVNVLVPKDKKKILAYIDYEFINDKLQPHQEDNVFQLANYIEQQDSSFNIIRVPINRFGGIVEKNSLRDRLKKLYDMLTAKVILHKMPPYITEHYTKNQVVIALGYFIPFKADYLDIPKWYVIYSRFVKKGVDFEKCHKEGKNIVNFNTFRDRQFNKMNFTYVTASQYANKIISRSHNIPLKNFKVLGTPNSDRKHQDKNNELLCKMFNLKFIPKKLIIYTPTFRDDLACGFQGNIPEKEQNIFGYSNEKEILEDFLVQNDILLIVKLHKTFHYYRKLEELLIKEDNSYFRNCYFLTYELETKYNTYINHFFGMSDAMIADYSSISFDYLYVDKPIIYNVYDIEKYRSYRGFSYEPIEEMMAGEQVATIEKLQSAILDVVNGKDAYKEQRQKVFNMINEVEEGTALSNIYNYIIDKLNVK